MADITNTQAVKFCNEQVRPLADRLAQAFYDAQLLVDAWNALGMSTLIPNTADNVADGAATDGRPIIKGSYVSNVINRASEMLTDFKASGNAKLNTVLQVAVNTQP